MNLRRTGLLSFGLCGLLSLGLAAAEPFVEGDGTRGVTLDWFMSPQSRVEVDFALTATRPVQMRVFGADDWTAGLCASLYVNNGGEFSFGAGDRFQSHPTGVPADTARHVAVLDFPARRARLLTGGRVVAEREVKVPCTRKAAHPLAVLARTVSPSGRIYDGCAKARIYGVRIFEGGRLVRDFAPAVERGVPGLRDRVAGHFAENGWRVPHWETILTAPGALTDERGHIQGMCISSNALYFTMMGGFTKTDWRGRLVRKARQPVRNVHTGDICHWRGRLYAALCSFPDGPFFGKDAATGKPLRGMLQVLDEDLNVVKQRAIPRPPDGIVCLDGVLYVGLSVARLYADKPWRGNWYGKFDAETLEPLCDPFTVDHGHDSYAGVQNIATDGEFLYVNFYTPDETARTPNFVKFDRDFKVLGVTRFGYGQGFDFVPGGKAGAVRFICCDTVNWLTATGEGTGLGLQGCLTFAEWDGKAVRDLTRHNGYRTTLERW